MVSVQPTESGDQPRLLPTKSGEMPIHPEVARSSQTPAMWVLQEFQRPGLSIPSLNPKKALRGYTPWIDCCLSLTTGKTPDGQHSGLTVTSLQPGQLEQLSIQCSQLPIPTLAKGTDLWRCLKYQPNQSMAKATADWILDLLKTGMDPTLSSSLTLRMGQTESTRASESDPPQPTTLEKLPPLLENLLELGKAAFYHAQMVGDDIDTKFRLLETKQADPLSALMSFAESWDAFLTATLSLNQSLQGFAEHITTALKPLVDLDRPSVEFSFLAFFVQIFKKACYSTISRVVEETWLRELQKQRESQGCIVQSLTPVQPAATVVAFDIDAFLKGQANVVSGSGSGPGPSNAQIPKMPNMERIMELRKVFTAILDMRVKFENTPWLEHSQFRGSPKLVALIEKLQESTVDLYSRWSGKASPLEKFVAMAKNDKQLVEIVTLPKVAWHAGLTQFQFALIQNKQQILHELEKLTAEDTQKEPEVSGMPPSLRENLVQHFRKPLMAKGINPLQFTRYLWNHNRALIQDYLNNSAQIISAYQPSAADLDLENRCRHLHYSSDFP